MVTFVSLFLWLITGVHQVEVAVEDPVTSVEILLDDTVIGFAAAPDWKISCDFGRSLTPHRLVAIARDENGVELDRAHQVINLPRPNAEVEIVFEEHLPDVRSAIRVVAQSAVGHSPENISVVFDDQLLVGQDGRYELPEYDEDQVHLLNAEALFPGGVSARDDVTIGGPYRGQISTELTAVSVVAEGPRRPRSADLAGVLQTGNKALTVSAVERPGGRVYLVRDHKVWPLMREVGNEMHRRFPSELKTLLTDGGAISHKTSRYYLVVPNPTRRGELSLFHTYGPYGLRRFNLPWKATSLHSTEAVATNQHLAAAVAAAGIRAARDSSPRVVILVLSGAAEDASPYTPEEIREFLRAINVPLVVWTLGNIEETGWGPSKDISSPKKIRNAAQTLMKSLHRQWIVWVDGQFLPSEVEITESADGFHFAGAD